eukprot:9686600-Lingulodinium_polyedra.AAC.1
MSGARTAVCNGAHCETPTRRVANPRVYPARDDRGKRLGPGLRHVGVCDLLRAFWHETRNANAAQRALGRASAHICATPGKRNRKRGALQWHAAARAK